MVSISGYVEPAPIVTFAAPERLTNAGRPKVMSDIVVRVDNLSKEYKIGALKERPDMFRAWLVNKFRRSTHDARDESLWALKGVSFAIKQGEVLGVIGRNGAGKSTLLKILSRITEPTGGRIEMEGRVGSLLEVGTGFHPELTGRENIFLSGAILGMRRSEIDQRFDEIVDFSGVEKFLDTPFKRYSSGMKVRLGFAVAAHLEPEILLVDEVLAVGDLAFQKKSLGKMSQVAGQGRTVVFVSHNMAAIRKLCSRALWIHNGIVQKEGDVASVTEAYVSLSQRSNIDQSTWLPIINEKFGIEITWIEVQCLAEDNGRIDLQVQIDLSAKEKLPNIGVGLAIFSIDGVPISILRPSVTNFSIPELFGMQTCRITCPAINRSLAGGTYIISAWLELPRSEYLVKAEEVATFSLNAEDIYSTGVGYEAKIHGVVPLKANFHIED